MKNLQVQKGTPLDCMDRLLYQLQAYYYNEIQRGLAGLGEFQLSMEHKGLSFLPITSFSWTALHLQTL